MALTREDLQAIKILLEENLLPVKESLERVEERVRAVERRLEAVEERVEAVERKLEAVEERTAAVEARLGAVEERVEAIERRLGTVECTLKKAEEDLGTVKRKVINLELNLENRTDRNLRILDENHLSLIEKLDGVVLIAERTRLQGLEISNLRSRVECVEEKVLKLEGQSA